MFNYLRCSWFIILNNLILKTNGPSVKKVKIKILICSIIQKSHFHLEKQNNSNPCQKFIFYKLDHIYPVVSSTSRTGQILQYWYQYNTWISHTNNLCQYLTLLSINVLFNKKLPFSFRKEVWIMDPATDTYYYWLLTISIPVFYNLMLLVARSEFMAFCISTLPYCCFRGLCHGFASL